MFHTIRRATKDPFFRNSALFFSASMVVAFLNYLFHPVLARLLSLQDFGDVQAILAMFGILSTIMGGFSIATVHASVNCEDQNECSAVIASLRRTALILILSIFVILTVGSRFFATELHFSSPWLFVILGGSLVMGALQIFRTGYLQGQRNFKAVSIANILISGGRVLFSAVFVLLGWRAFGASFGILSAQIISFAYVFCKTRKILSAHATALSSERVREELGYVVFFAVSTIFVTALYTTSVLVVKRFFSPEIAGAFSGISTIANIVFFATSSFATVLLSSIKRTHANEERRKIFFKATALISVIGLSFSLLCLVFPSFITRILIGARYVPYAYLLPWLVFAFFFASLVNVCVYYSLAMRQKGLILLAICVSFALVLLIAIRHDSPLQIAQNYLAINVIALIAMGIFVSRQLKKV
ncbi:MAG: oligosaccharide flippase family protein [Patescibacteria group bacterium]